MSKLFRKFQYPTAPLKAHWDADDLARSLAKLRPPRARITVTQAVLVDQQQLWRDTYTWTVVAEVPLSNGHNRSTVLVNTTQHGDETR